MIYTSGQIALDPKTNELVPGDFAAQANRVMKNLQAVLRAGGSDFNRVIKATVYLTDLDNFKTLNAIYEEYFGTHKPARTTIEASKLPKGSLLEIDLIALG